MPERLRGLGGLLRRRAENVIALLLGVMFVAFLVQVAFRYVFNFPIGWSTELTLITWLWLVLFGAAFVVTEREEIRFDLVYGAMRKNARLVATIVTHLFLIVLYAISLPEIIDYVLFMKVQETSYLDIRFDYLYFIYPIFAVATIGRYAWLLWQALRGRAAKPFDPNAPSSGL